EACLEAIKTGAIVAIQDMGAAGLTSSSSEMAGRGGLGIELELDRVPLREANLTPYEILLSESQERMLIVAAHGREGELAAVFEKWDLHAVVIGRITDDGRWRARWKGQVVADVPAAALRAIIASPNVASRRMVFRQYDSIVQGNTMVGPGSDAAVLRIKGSRRGLAL